MAFPTRTKYLIIGAGIHGLSTAWHLGEALRRSGRGSGKDILVVDKSGIASGVNSAAARLGSLLAVAGMTLFVFFSFERHLQTELGPLAVNPEIKGQLIAQ